MVRDAFFSGTIQTVGTIPENSEKYIGTVPKISEGGGSAMEILNPEKKFMTGGMKN